MLFIMILALQEASGPLHNVSACLDAAFGTDEGAYEPVKLCFWTAPMTIPCIVLGQLLLLGLSHAHTIIGFSLLASIGAIVSYLFLLGACSDFYSLDLVLISCQLFLAVLLEASMLPGCAHIVVVWLLQMKCT